MEGRLFRAFHPLGKEVQKKIKIFMTISFNKNIYPLKAIKKTIQAYKNLAKFKIIEEKENFTIELTDIKKEVENIIKDEFCNYVLSQVRE